MKKTLFALVIAAFFAAVASYGATYTNATIGGTGFAWKNTQKTVIVEASHDFSVQSVTTNDVIQMVSVPANARVLAVAVEVDTTSTQNTNTTQTIDIGDGTTPAGYVSNRSLLTASQSDNAPTLTATLTPYTTTNGSSGGVAYLTNGAVTVTTTPTYGLGKTYTADDTIDITADGVLIDGVVKVKALIADLTQ